MYLYHQLTAADLLAAQDVLNETTAVVKIVSDFRNRLTPSSPRRVYYFLGLEIS